MFKKFLKIIKKTIIKNTKVELDKDGTAVHTKPPSALNFISLCLQTVFKLLRQLGKSNVFKQFRSVVV